MNILLRPIPNWVKLSALLETRKGLRLEPNLLAPAWRRLSTLFPPTPPPPTAAATAACATPSILLTSPSTLFATHSDRDFTNIARVKMHTEK